MSSKAGQVVLIDDIEASWTNIKGAAAKYLSNFICKLSDFPFNLTLHVPKQSISCFNFKSLFSPETFFSFAALKCESEGAKLWINYLTRTCRLFSAAAFINTCSFVCVGTGHMCTTDKFQFRCWREFLTPGREPGLRFHSVKEAKVQWRDITGQSSE